MLIMLIKKVTQSCRLENKAKFVHWSIEYESIRKPYTFHNFSGFMDGN